MIGTYPGSLGVRREERGWVPRLAERWTADALGPTIGVMHLVTLAEVLQSPRAVALPLLLGALSVLAIVLVVVIAVRRTRRSGPMDRHGAAADADLRPGSPDAERPRR